MSYIFFFQWREIYAKCVDGKSSEGHRNGQTKYAYFKETDFRGVFF